MISSPSAQIVNAIAESTFVSDVGGPRVDAYGPVMGIATAIIAVGIAVTAAFGPEKRGSRFESAVVGQQTEAMAADAKLSELENGEKSHKVAVGEVEVEVSEKKI
jgi:hypothetical protein